MKSLIIAVCVVLGFLPVRAFAETDTSDRCRLRIGHERPAGCALVRPRTAQPGAEQQGGKRTSPPVKSERPPEAAWMEALRYPKHWASQKRSTRLLMQELTRLERLLAVTPRRSPERPRIVRRLADGYAELEQLAAVERMRAELNLAAAEARERAGTP